MKIFIWKRVGQCSYNYHTEGGVTVIAETEERARELANELEYCDILPEEIPDLVANVDYMNEKVFIFPDAGCC